MLGHARRFRTRSPLLARLRVRPQPGLFTEGLEPRRLLAVSQAIVTVAPIAPIANGLPLPGLASGYAAASPASIPSGAISVASPSVNIAPGGTAAGTIPAATGPATTLTQLMTDSETANAESSEVARPTPGRSDRISIILGSPEVAPVPTLRVPTNVEVVPGPNFERFVPLVPIEPVTTTPAPSPALVVVLPVESALAFVRDMPAQQGEMSEPINFQVWDVALELLTHDLAPKNPMVLTRPTEAALAAGMIIAAWTGWKSQTSTAGRSRQRPSTVPVARTQPLNGAGR